MAKVIKKINKKFWDQEYSGPRHLKISTEPSGDLLKFFRWNERQREPLVLNNKSFVVDLGCGNGRNIINIATDTGAHGYGCDISESAISQAKKASVIGKTKLGISYEVRSVAGTYPNIPDESVDLVLDMMVSHFLRASERELLIKEVYRMLRPGGFYIFKTFLADGDIHVKKLLQEHPADEPGAYIHPEMKVYEYVYTENEVKRVMEQYFDIHKIEKSHKHISHGKRRSMIVYLEKRW
ncbi:MAG: class I SAM-dependent methyltransferase [Minisyncoccia bacterium]